MCNILVVHPLAQRRTRYPQPYVISYLIHNMTQIRSAAVSFAVASELLSAAASHFVLFRVDSDGRNLPHSSIFHQFICTERRKDAYITSIYQRCFKLGAHFSISECMTHMNRYRNEKKKKQTQLSMVNSEHTESGKRNGESCRTILIKHMCFPMRNSN